MTRDVPSGSLFTGFEKTVARVIKQLAPHFSAIRKQWERQMEMFGISQDQAQPLFGLTFEAQRQHLEKGSFDAWKLSLERVSEDLAGRGISEETAALVVPLYLESCMAHVPSSARDAGRQQQALARLAAVSQLFLLAGYTGRRAAGWRTLDEQERHRLSRDLHDDIGHSLVVLKLYLEMIQMDLAKNRADLVDQKLQEALVLVGTGIQSVRRLILDLGPAILEEVGFVPAVKLYARQFASRTGIQVTVQDNPLPGGLPQTHETALYRVLQGALSNVVKHANAQNVRIKLGSVKAVVILIIEDDGVGFHVESKKQHQAFGLSAMRERIQSLGGRIHIESPATAGRRGTRIEVDLPLPREVAPAEQKQQAS